METLAGLPHGCDPQRLGLDAGQITGVECLHRRHGHAVYRVRHGATSFVLKWFPAPDGACSAGAGDRLAQTVPPAVEVRHYALLRAHGVPTLPLHGYTERALLLEDVATGPEWRLATEMDVTRAETGVAVAAWYRVLHEAGRSVVGAPGGPPQELQREGDALDEATIVALGRRLGTDGDPVWALAAGAIEALKAALRALPETLIYDDFHYTNLALSHRPSPLRAIVFDYHQLGLGPVASDYRNVSGGLGRPAREAFRKAYGPVDEREVILDAAVAPLYAWSIALRRPQPPAWVQQDVRRLLARGGLARLIRRALDVL